jgi:hypothetical protein
MMSRFYVRLRIACRLAVRADVRAALADYQA